MWLFWTLGCALSGNSAVHDSFIPIQINGHEIRVEVVAFDNLASSQKDDIEKVVAKSLGKKVKLETKMDKSIIGGLIIRIGSKMIDSSVRSKLLKLQTIMKEGN